MNIKNIIPKRQSKRGATATNSYKDSMFRNPPPRNESMSSKSSNEIK